MASKTISEKVWKTLGPAAHYYEIKFSIDEYILHNMTVRPVVAKDGFIYIYCVFPNNFHFIKGRATTCFLMKINDIDIQHNDRYDTLNNLTIKNINNLIFELGPILTVKIFDVEQQLLIKLCEKNDIHKYGLKFVTVKTIDSNIYYHFIKKYIHPESDMYEIERIISLNGVSVYAYTHEQLVDMLHISTRAKILVEIFEIIISGPQSSHILVHDYDV